MGVKMLTERRGQLQGLDVDTIVRQAYGPGFRYEENAPGVDHVGDILRPDGTLADLVVEVHDV